MCSQTSGDFVGCCPFKTCNKCESERVKSKPLRLSLPYLVWVLPVSPPRKASKKKIIMDWILPPLSVWPVSPIRTSNSSDLCGDLSQSIRSQQRNRGLAPDLTCSPFINMCPCELILIAHVTTCQTLHSDFNNVCGGLILGLYCTETTQLLRRHLLHSSWCNYRARRFPTAWR